MFHLDSSAMLAPAIRARHTNLLRISRHHPFLIKKYSTARTVCKFSRYLTRETNNGFNVNLSKNDEPVYVICEESSIAIIESCRSRIALIESAFSYSLAATHPLRLPTMSSSDAIKKERRQHIKDVHIINRRNKWILWCWRLVV